MPRFAANLSMMFNEVPFLDRFAAAAKAGFTAVEFLFPYDYPPEEVGKRSPHDPYCWLVDLNAVLVEMRGGDAELAHDVAVHVAFARPSYLRREDVPKDEVDAERITVENLSRNEGKPEAALPKIVEGRMNGWFKERCLLEQPYAKDEKRTIADLIGSAEIVRFAQVVVGG